MDSYTPADTDLLDPIAPDLHWQYRQTKDVRFAALAIGRWPSHPPIWAVLVCYGEHEVWLRSAGTGHDRARIGKLLDEMLKVYFDHENAFNEDQSSEKAGYKPPTRVSVLKKAMERKEVDQAEEGFRALLIAVDRRMDEEAEAERDTDGDLPWKDANGLRTTKRYYRVALEHEAERNNGMTYHLSLLKFLQDRASNPG